MSAPADAASTTAPKEQESPWCNSAARWIFWGLLIPMVLHSLRALNVVLTHGTPFDTEATYLPYARSFLDNPKLFLASEEAFSVAPINYIFMALNQADITMLKITDLGMSLLVILLLFDAGNRLAGRWAGASASWLYAISPSLITLSILPQSEPPFFTMTALWLWCVVYACVPYHADTPRPPYRAWSVTVLGGIALGMATLTRGTYIYWIPTAILVCGVCLIGARTISHAWLRPLATRLLLMHAVALIIVGSWLIHNQSVFHKANIATGTGISLYLGNNPLTNGYEPPYHGLVHDNQLATPVSHLSSAGDQRLQAIALLMIRDTPVQFSIPMYWEKLGAFLFFSKAHYIARSVTNERAWRIMLLSLVLLGVYIKRRNPAVWLLTGALCYQIIVHLPVQFNPRYSIGAIDLYLTLLAGLGVAALAQSRRPAAAISVWALIVTIGALVGAYNQRHSRPIMPDLSKVPHHLLNRANISDIETHGFQGDPFSQDATIQADLPSIVWRNAELGPAGYSIIRLGVSKFPSTCRKILYTFDVTGEPQRNDQLRIDGLSAGDDITRGTLALTRTGSDNTRGTLTLKFDCPLGTHAQFNGLETYQASMGQYYGQQLDQNVQKSP